MLGGGRRGISSLLVMLGGVVSLLTAYWHYLALGSREGLRDLVTSSDVRWSFESSCVCVTIWFKVFRHYHAHVLISSPWTKDNSWVPVLGACLSTFCVHDIPACDGIPGAVFPYWKQSNTREEPLSLRARIWGLWVVPICLPVRSLTAHGGSNGAISTLCVLISLYVHRWD